MAETQGHHGNACHGGSTVAWPWCLPQLWVKRWLLWGQSIWQMWDECGSVVKTPQSQRLWCFGNPTRSHKHLDVVCTCMCMRPCIREWIDNLLGICWLASGRDKSFRRSKLSIFLHSRTVRVLTYDLTRYLKCQESGITWINSKVPSSCWIWYRSENSEPFCWVDVLASFLDFFWQWKLPLRFVLFAFFADLSLSVLHSCSFCLFGFLFFAFGA